MKSSTFDRGLILQYYLQYTGPRRDITVKTSGKLFSSRKLRSYIFTVHNPISSLRSDRGPEGPAFICV